MRKFEEYYWDRRNRFLDGRRVGDEKKKINENKIKFKFKCSFVI